MKKIIIIIKRFLLWYGLVNLSTVLAQASDDFDFSSIEIEAEHDNAFEFNNAFGFEEHRRVANNDDALRKREYQWAPELSYQNDIFQFKLSGELCLITPIDETEDDPEFESSLLELFVDFSLPNSVHMRLGRQIVAWGESDFFHGESLTDRASSRDLSEIGILSLEDARLPVLSSLFGFYINKHKIEWLNSFESRKHSLDDVGGDFDPYRPILSDQLIIEQRKESEFDGLVDSYLRLSGQLNSGDYSVLVGRGENRNPLLQFDGVFIDQSAVINEILQKNNIIGFSYAYPISDFVLKTELLATHDKQFMRSDLLAQLNNYAVAQRSAVDSFYGSDSLQTMIGLNYFGFNDWFISVELFAENIVEHNELFLQEQNSGHISSMIQWQPSSYDFEFNLVYIKSFKQSSDLIRIQSSYQMSDGLSVDLGLALYNSTRFNSMFHAFEDQDRAYLRLSYEF